MKKFTLQIVYIGLLISLGPSCRSGVNIPTPVVLPESLITVSVPDIHKTLDAVQTLIDQIWVEGATFSLKATIGEMIGDPELATIPADSGGALVWNGFTWYAVLECQPDALQHIPDLLTNMMLIGEFQENLLIVAKNQFNLDKGKAQAATVVTTLLDREYTGAVINVQLADIVKIFEAQINMVMMMMPGMMMQGAAQLPEAQMKNMQTMGRLVEGEMRVLVSLASQVDSLEIRVLPSKESLEISHILSAKKDSNLAALITAPDTLIPDPAISASMLEPGTMGIEMFIGNPDALMAFIDAETQKIITEMKLDPAKIATWTDMVKSWSTLMSGSLAETFSMSLTEGYSVGYIGTVQDEQKLLTMLEALPEMMQPFMKMYEEMGMPMQMDLKMNVRNYKDLSIHQYDFSYDIAEMDPLMAEQFKLMKMDKMNSELTVSGNRLLWTMGGQSLDQLIDRLASGEKGGEGLHARKVYPEGGIAYYDLDMGAYMGFVSSMMPDEHMNPVFTTLAENLKNAAPLSGAVFKQENRIECLYKIPVIFLKQFGLFWLNEQKIQK